MFVSFADLPVSIRPEPRPSMSISRMRIDSRCRHGDGDWRWVEVRFPGAQTALISAQAREACLRGR